MSIAIIKYRRPPLSAILTSATIQDIESRGPTVTAWTKEDSVKPDNRMIEYIATVNAACGFKAEYPKTRDQSKPDWIPNPKQTYSLSEIVDYLAARGVERYRFIYRPLPIKRKAAVYDHRN